MENAAKAVNMEVPPTFCSTSIPLWGRGELMVEVVASLEWNGLMNRWMDMRMDVVSQWSWTPSRRSKSFHFSPPDWYKSLKMWDSREDRCRNGCSVKAKKKKRCPSFFLLLVSTWTSKVGEMDSGENKLRDLCLVEAGAWRRRRK